MRKKPILEDWQIQQNKDFVRTLWRIAVAEGTGLRARPMSDEEFEEEYEKYVNCCNRFATDPIRSHGCGCDCHNAARLEVDCPIEWDADATLHITLRIERQM